MPEHANLPVAQRGQQVFWWRSRKRGFVRTLVVKYIKHRYSGYILWEGQEWDRPLSTPKLFLRSLGRRPSHQKLKIQDNTDHQNFKCREEIGPHRYTSPKQGQRALEHLRFPHAELPGRRKGVQSQLQSVLDLKFEQALRKVGGDPKLHKCSKESEKENCSIYFAENQTGCPEGFAP